MNRRSFSLLASCLLLTSAACGSGAGSGGKSATSVSRSTSSATIGRPGRTADASPTIDLLVVAPLPKARIHATRVVLGTTSEQIGRVVQVDARGAYEARISIALDRAQALHGDATALVCDNLIRISPGSSSAPATADIVITLAHTSIRPGDC